MSDLDELFKSIKDQPEEWPADACHYAKVDENLICDYDWIEAVHLYDGRWGPIKLHVIDVTMNDGRKHTIGVEVYEMSGNHQGEFELRDMYEVTKKIVETHEWKRI